MKSVISWHASLLMEVAAMAGVIEYGKIMFIIMNFHESPQLPIKSILRAAVTPLGTRTFVGQIDDLGIIPELLLEYSLEFSHLETSDFESRKFRDKTTLLLGSCRLGIDNPSI